MIRRRNTLSCFFLILVIFLSFLSQGYGWEASPQENLKREPLSSASKQWLEEVVPYIITSKEKEVFISLPTEVDRGQFIETFWKKRDPNPQTPENEYKVEYFKRIAAANKQFGTGGIAGWRTDRGKIYILLGPPKEIQRDMNPSSSQNSLTAAFSGPKETWQYWGLPNPNLPYNLEISFVDKFNTGNYMLDNSFRVDSGRNRPFDISDMTYQFNAMEYMAEAQKNPFEGFDKLKEIITTQVSYAHIPFQADVFSLKGSANKTTVPLVITLPIDSLQAKRVENKRYYSLSLILNISNPLGQLILEKSKNVDFQKPLPENTAPADRNCRLLTSLVLEPARYRLHLLILDNFSGKVGTFHEDITVPNFEAGDLALSTIILSSVSPPAEEQPGGGAQGAVSEERLFSEAGRIFHPGMELNVYCEAYNLAVDQESKVNNFNVEFFFLQAGKVLAQIAVPPNAPNAQTDCRIQTSFKLKNFRPGAYVLQVKVTDRLSGKSQTQEAPFTIAE